MTTRRRLLIALAIFSLAFAALVTFSGWDFRIAAYPILFAWAAVLIDATTHVRRAFMSQFAKDHNLTYAQTAPLESVSGRLFAVGHSKKLSHVMSGFFEKYPMRLFTYHYTIGSGKNSRTYPFTVMEIAFPRTNFPFILLRSTTMPRFGARDSRGAVRDRRIPLEPVFEKHFQLLSSSGYEIEAMQIFTPSILHFLLAEGDHFSIEFAANKMYIYDDQGIGVDTKLEKLHDVATKIYATLSPLLNRLHDDFAALHPYYDEKDPGQMIQDSSIGVRIMGFPLR
jgi:hypothetical protein